MKISLVALGVALLFFCFGIFFGLDFSDSFYHLNQALHPEDNIYLYPFLLSSILINGILEVAGYDIIYLRFINSSFLLLSFFLPFLLIHRTKLRKHNILMLSCCLFVFAPFNVNILGYDTLSIFFLALIFSISVLYLFRLKWYLIPVIALLCSLAVLIRLPNLLVIPILGLFFYFTHSDRRRVMRIFISSGFILLSLSGILAGYYSYYGAYAAFIKATSNANSHFVSELLANYIKDGTTVLLYMVILLTFHYLFVRFKRRVSATKSITWLTVGVVIFMVFFITPSKYSVDYALFILAIALTFTTISIFELRNSSKECLILSLFFLFLFINPFGSNTGLLKGYSMFVLFPFIYSFINPKSKSFWATILVLLLPLAIFTKFFGIYEDKNIFSLTAVPNHELISPIRTNEIRSDFLNSVGDRIDYFEENNIKVLFYGSKSHIFHYLYPNTSIQSSGFFQPLDNLNYLPHILSEISTDHETVIFLVSSYPEKNGIQGISLLEKELIDRGFKRVQDSSVVILQRMPLKRNPVD